MKSLTKTLTLLIGITTLALCGTAQAQVVIGSWQGTDDGWQDWNGGSPVSISTLTGKYSYATGVVPGYAQSLQITQSGFNQGLTLNVPVAAFNANHILNFTFSAPAALGGTTSGFMQMYAVTLNAPGYGFNNIVSGTSWPNTTETGNTSFNQPSSPGQPNYYYFPGSPFETQVVSIDYSSVLPSIIAGGEGYLQMIFTSNNDGGAGGDPNYFYMNNVTLSGGPVPEPTSLALLGGGLLALGVIRRRK